MPSSRSLTCLDNWLFPAALDHTREHEHVLYVIVEQMPGRSWVVSITASISRHGVRHECVHCVILLFQSVCLQGGTHARRERACEDGGGQTHMRMGAGARTRQLSVGRQLISFASVRTTKGDEMQTGAKSPPGNRQRTLTTIDAEWI